VPVRAGLVVRALSAEQARGIEAEVVEAEPATGAE
jgi:hypothetical protein